MDWLRRLWIERRHVLEAETDAHPAQEHPRHLLEQDAEARRRTKSRRRTLLGIALAALFVAGIVAAVLGEGGYYDLEALQEEAGQLEAAVAGLKLDVQILEAEIQGLEDDPTARERIAREELGFIAPGEIDLLLPRSEPEPGTPEP